MYECIAASLFTVWWRGEEGRLQSKAQKEESGPYWLDYIMMLPQQPQISLLTFRLILHKNNNVFA